METRQNLGNLSGQWKDEIKEAAGDIAERMKAEGVEGTDGPFVEMEDLAVEVSRQIGEEILRLLLAQQAESQEEPMLQCQKCGGPCEGKPPRRRSLTTRVGKVAWHEPVHYCHKCRRSFSPSVRTIED